MSCRRRQMRHEQKINYIARKHRYQRLDEVCHSSFRHRKPLIRTGVKPQNYRSRREKTEIEIKIEIEEAKRPE
jgi:hypothetical protein